MGLTGIHQVYSRTVPIPVRRFIYRLRTGYHFKRWAAYLTDENIHQKNIIRRLAPLRNKYQGQRCFVMGNGPSLNQMNLELFNGEYVWAANKCYLLFDHISWRPAFYVAVDTRVVPNIAAEISQLTHKLPQTHFFLPAHFRQQWVLHSTKNLYWFNEVPLDYDNLPDGAFTRDASKWMSSSRTVTVAALQMAVYLGFNPIYLIGCDTSYTVPKSVNFELGNPDNLTSTDDDPNHFDPNYFGKGSKWTDPHVDGMIFHYEQAKKVCDSLGVQIYNATVGGQLEVFPRIDYTNLF